MFNPLRKYRLIAQFANERRSDYAQLASAEWAQLSHVLVRLAIGGGLALVGSLFFLTFLSVAVIVSAWESDWRILTAWLVAAVWLVIGGIGGFAIVSALKSLNPFRQVRDELGKDLAVVRGAL